MGKPFVLVIVAALLGGCATIIEGSSDNIATGTPGADGARCTLTSPEATYHVTTPGTVTVEKTKHNISVACQRDGYADGVATLPSEFEEWTIANILWLYAAPIAVVVDWATGAIHDYPDSISIPMERTRQRAAAQGTPMPGVVPVVRYPLQANYGVHFASYQDLDLAQRGWTDFWNKHWQLLSGVQPYIDVESPAAGVRQYGLYGWGLSKERAEGLCRNLRQQNEYCKVVYF